MRRKKEIEWCRVPAVVVKDLSVYRSRTILWLDKPHMCHTEKSPQFGSTNTYLGVHNGRTRGFEAQNNITSLVDVVVSPQDIWCKQTPSKQKEVERSH